MDLAHLNKKRCSAFCLNFMNNIFVYGGYEGDRKRSKKIEAFDIINNKWKIVNFKLMYGVER